MRFLGTRLVLGLAALLCYSGGALGQTGPCSNPVDGQLFCDDFSDGDYSDATPVTWRLGWEQVHHATRVEGDRFILEGTDIPWAWPQEGELAADGHIDGDVSIRAQGKVLVEDGGMALGGRDKQLGDQNGPYAYWAGLNDDEPQPVAASVLLLNGTIVWLSETPVNIDMSEDIVMQFDIIGDRLSFWAWQAGSVPPSEPLLSVVDDRLDYSRVSIAATDWNWGRSGGPAAAAFDYVQVATQPIPIDTAVVLQPGDANQDMSFDQLDLVAVLVAGKYMSGETATWGEGDWDGAPGGEPGSPPPGNGLFDQFDVIAALGNGKYLTGVNAAVLSGGQANDDQTSVIYNAITGEMGVDAPTSTELTSINIDSAAAIVTGDPAQNLGGSFDNDADDNIFKATFGSSFGSLSFGNVAQPGLSADFVAGDLTVVGSLAGGGDLGNVDLIDIPEPSTAFLALLGGLAMVTLGRRR